MKIQAELLKGYKMDCVEVKVSVVGKRGGKQYVA